MNLLQLAFIVNGLVPSIEEFNGKTYVQYDIKNKHIRFELDDADLCQPSTFLAVEQRVREWPKYEVTE